MDDETIEFSIIIPTFNPDYKIVETLKSIKESILFFEKIKRINFEILIINDGGKKIDFQIIKIIKNIKIINLKKNRGVGYAREVGARISKFKKLVYIDSDIIIKRNTLNVLYEEFNKSKNVGSLGALQSYENLNSEYTSKFVCAKTCYGFENKPQIIEFSAIHSECCIIDKIFLRNIGGWKFYSKSGGEEFELGHRILKSKKKNYLTKKTSYSTYYENILDRCNKIIYRTSNYLPIFLKRKKFESEGAFATNTQVLSAFLTLSQITLVFFSFFLQINNIFILILFILNLFTEFNFFKFIKKLYDMSYIPFSILGVYLINFSIILGFFYGLLNLIKKKLIIK